MTSIERTAYPLRLIEHYRTVLGHLDPRSPAGDEATAVRLARETVTCPPSVRPPDRDLRRRS